MGAASSSAAASPSPAFLAIKASIRRAESAKEILRAIESAYLTIDDLLSLLTTTRVSITELRNRQAALWRQFERLLRPFAGHLGVDEVLESEEMNALLSGLLDVEGSIVRLVRGRYLRVASAKRIAVHVARKLEVEERVWNYRGESERRVRLELKQVVRWAFLLRKKEERLARVVDAMPGGREILRQ